MLLVVSMAGVLVLALAPATAAQRPNIVVVLTDDQRFDTLSAMPTVQSELVAKGVNFTNAFVVNPLCCPSRASLLTGRYSHSTGVYDNRPPHGGFRSFRDGSTIAVWLQRAGYHTALFGKYLNGYLGRYVPPGWDRWVALTRLGYYEYGLNVNGSLDPPRRRTLYSTDRLATAARAFIRTRRGPVFVVFAPFAPHAPATPALRHKNAFTDIEPWRPPSFNEADLSDKPAWLRAHPLLARAPDEFRRLQLASLLAVDEGVALILQTLRETGRLRNSVIIFTSDNGYLWGEHRLVDKTVAYEESIRVPLVVRYDRLAVPARAESRPTLNIDVAPTVAALAGTAAPQVQGRSFLPLLTGGPTPWRTRFLIEASRPPLPAYCALREATSTLVVWATGEQELYDLSTDPHQLQSLHLDPAWAPTLAALRPRLARMCHPTPPGFRRRTLCTHTGSGASETLTGSRGFDIICARAGNDRVEPGRHADIVFAGGGNDLVLARGGGRDTIVCDGGRDRVLADRADVVGRSCETVRRR
jgi:N-acetylglucosamine-6-sulfatase